MKHYVGLDVSLKEVSICVIDADGVVAAEGKVSTEPALIVPRRRDDWALFRVYSLRKIIGRVANTSEH